jgi:hypothetical protein
MSFWDEVKKATSKAEDLYGTATRIMSTKQNFQPVGIPATTQDVIPVAPAQEPTMGEKAKGYWSNLPKPVQYGSYAVGGLLVLGIAKKFLK